MALSLTILCSIAYIGSRAIPGADRQTESMLATICALLSMPILVCLWRIVFPRQLEVVIEDSQIRWGRADRINEQKSIRIEQIRRIIHDHDSRRVIADMGGWIKPSIGYPVLLSFRDQLDFVSVLSEKFPGIKVEVNSSGS
jgi:hypothetical protein